MKRFIGYLAVVTFCFSVIAISSANALSREQALEELIFEKVRYDFGSYYSPKSQPWRIDTFEDTDPIPMKLFLSGATIRDRQTYSRRQYSSHMPSSSYRSYRNKFGNETVYLVDDVNQLGFIRIAAGIHSAPPPMPYGSTQTQAEYWASKGWPCSGWCGNLIGAHSDTAFCMNEYTGIPYSGGESYFPNETSSNPGMQVYSVHIADGSKWSFFTGSQWKSWVSSNYYTFNCHSCICRGPSYTRSWTTRSGRRRTRRYCCHNRSNTRTEYNVNFYPSITGGTSWNACQKIKSANYIAKGGQIHWLDRTPPIVKYFSETDQPTDGYFPNADATDGANVFRCTSGDYRKLSLKLWDQNVWSDSISHRIAIAPASWTFDSRNSGDGRYRFVKFDNDSFVNTTRSGQEPKAVKMPNHIYGSVGYTIYAWDATKNLNPGVSNVDDNNPTNCYGVCPPGSGKQYNGKSGQDLLTNPSTAKPFTFRVSNVNTDLPRTDSPISYPYLPQNNGYINVHDNDLPNLMISIVNTRDKAKASTKPSLTYNYCFPAPPQTDFQAIWNQAEYQNFKKGLKFTYEDFLATDTVYLMPLIGQSKYGETGPDAEDKTSIFPGSDSSISSLIGVDPKKQNSNFRTLFSLEDFNVSDTVKSTGILNTDISDLDALRKRNGFGKELNAFMVMPIEEDVEYEISIWAQDNSRYKSYESIPQNPQRAHSGFQPDFTTGSPGSGISNISVVCQEGSKPQPEFSQTISGAQAWNKCVHGPYKVVFRDPSAAIADSGSVPDIITLNSNNPSIQVTVKDVADNERTLRLFFQIEDKKARIRTLEERHMR
jgi:hypothetical protein